MRLIATHFTSANHPTGFNVIAADGQCIGTAKRRAFAGPKWIAEHSAMIAAHGETAQEAAEALCAKLEEQA